MTRLFLMKNPELFQGEKYLNKNKNYFEGWYFKNTNNENGISFIPGININDKEKKAFIQVITNRESYFINYNIQEFKYKINPFYIQIGENIFSKRGIHIEIKEKKQKLTIYGDIKYSNSKNIKTSRLNPNIMGPFSYIPFMECNHAILSMKNNTQGSIIINDQKINLNSSIGYIEKDWGSSFPKKYIWCQANNFKKTNASFMISLAEVPLKLITFKGIICVLKTDLKEYKFTTYNNTKLIEYNVNNKILNITLKKNNYKLNIKSEVNNGIKLSAPVKGKMSKEIFESISSEIIVTLKKDDKIIFKDTSQNCGLEIV